MLHRLILSLSVLVNLKIPIVSKKLTIKITQTKRMKIKASEKILAKITM